jgi:hypothetical protein
MLPRRAKPKADKHIVERGASRQRYLAPALPRPIQQSPAALLAPVFLLDAGADLPYSSIVEGLEEFLCHGELGGSYE